MDWKRWHDAYDRPDSELARRLETVRARIRAALDEAPAGPLRAVSLCAGQGRDLIPVLAEHPRGRDVHARLVELDPENADYARQLVADAGLTRVEVVTGDASLTDHYLDLVPADLVLVCGIYGNLRLSDIERTVAACTALCASGGTVIWTRGRNPEPSVAPQIAAWYEELGFEQLWLADPDQQMCVGAYRYSATPTPLTPGVSLFQFVGYDVLYQRPARGCSPSLRQVRPTSFHRIPPTRYIVIPCRCPHHHRIGSHRLRRRQGRPSWHRNSSTE